jgi:predicted Zn-dependent protease
MVVSLAAAQLIGCSVNPVTGKRELMLMSEAQERELGASSDKAIVAQYGVVDDPELRVYVEGIGGKLVPLSHRPDIPFTFRVLDDPVVNAFALPGGFVYLTRGILGYLDNEAAMAGVLGHEIGHVTARHSAKRYTKQQLFGLGIGLGSVLSEEFAKYSNLAGAAAGLLLLKFSRDDESQSDRLGVEYATKAGYDTESMARFFHTLGQLSSGDGRLPTWASTHPDPGQRFDTVGRLSQEWQGKVGAASYAENRETYLRQIDGIVFGDNPRQGFVDEGMFRHPDLKFEFPVPDGWKVMNTASQVQLASPEGDAGVLFSIVSDETDPETAAAAFARDSGVRVVERRTLTVSGSPAVRIEARATAQQGELGVLSTFVGRDGHVYVFHGLSGEADFPAYRSVFADVAGGFRRLTDPDALAIQPVRLQIAPAPRSATFRELVRDHPLPDGAGVDLEGLALLNGVAPDDRISRGTLLKVLRRGR